MNHEIAIAVARTSLPAQVAAEIERLIAERAFTPGDRLPAERELALQLEVGRPVIREAIKILGSRGLVEIKPGSGVYIRHVESDDVVESLLRGLRFYAIHDNVEKMREVRRILEPEIAALAAERASARDLERLEQLLQQLVLHSGDTEPFIEADIELHLAIARAAGNELFAVLLEPLMGLLRDFMRGVAARRTSKPAKWVTRYHREIVERLKARDREGARKAMLAHLLE